MLVSLKKEIDYFLDLLGNVKKRKVARHTIFSGRIKGYDVEVIKTGIGKKPFEQNLLEGCSAVISVGFCGALAAGLRTGDIVVSTELVLADEKFLNGLYRAEGRSGAADLTGLEPKKIYRAASVYEKLLMLPDEDTGIHQGRTVTASRTIKNYKEKFTLGQKAGAVSVDMEDYYRAELADLIGVPFLSIRSVLDEVRNDVPGFGSGFHFRSHVSSFLKNLTPAAVSLSRVLENFFTLKLLK